jgi:hypothetical protein
MHAISWLGVTEQLFVCVCVYVRVCVYARMCVCVCK